MLMKLEDFEEQWEELVDKAMKDYNSLSRDERIWYNTQTLMEQAGNAGIISYYYNEGADHVMDAIEDLEIIGFTEPTGLLRRINDIFHSGTLSDIEKRNETINGWEDDRYGKLFEEADEKFEGFQKQFEMKILDFIVTNKLVCI
jgi:hypothetical protein